jgi:hypothetical protein
MFRELHKSREYGGQIIANQGVFFGRLRRGDTEKIDSVSDA